ncbi:MAG: hypothetical protein JSR18_16575 [Proteobacteria bacterium]|nr:hypothetical protein [Pseudomonadota bacterium]
MKSRTWTIAFIVAIAIAAWWWQRTPSAPETTAAATPASAPAPAAPAAPAGGAVAAGGHVATPAVMHSVPLPPLARGNAGDLMAAARDRAKAGDSSAAFAAYGALSRCWSYSDALAQSARPMHDLPTDQPARDLRLRAIANENKAAADALARDCNGYEAPTVDDRLRWLDLAAAGGDPVARTYYAQELLGMLRRDPEWMLHNPEELVRAEAAARDYTAAAAADGVREAMATMGNLYAEGTLFPKDIVEGYAWLAATMPAASAGNNERLRDLAAQMTPDQLTQATERARELRGG